MTYTFTDYAQIDEQFVPTEDDWNAVCDEEEGPGWDLYGWDDDQALEAFSLECAFGPED